MSKKEISQVVITLKLVASVAYLFMGIYLLINPDLLKTLGTDIPKNYITALAIILTLYGLFRLFRVYQSFNAAKTEVNDEPENY